MVPVVPQPSQVIAAQNSNVKYEPFYQFSVENVKIGDVFRFEFTLDYVPWIYKDNYTDLVREEIESKAEHFEIVRIYPIEDNKVIAYLRVIHNPLPFIVVFGAVVTGISFLLITFGMTVTKVERVIEKPVGAILSLGTLAIAGIVLWKWIL